MSAAAANLGELLVAEGDFEGAVDALRRAVALGGDRPSPEAALRLGELLYRRHELPEAERWLRRAADTGDSIRRRGRWCASVT